ncbi:MAG: hypothetical protein WDA25_03170 [Paracoccaceae bacterium]
MTQLSKTLLSGAAALALLASPVFAQDTPPPNDQTETPPLNDMADDVEQMGDEVDPMVDSVEDAADVLGNNVTADFDAGGKFESIANTPVGELAGTVVMGADANIGEIMYLARGDDGGVTVVVQLTGESDRVVEVDLNEFTLDSENQFVLSAETDLEGLPDHDSTDVDQLDPRTPLRAHIEDGSTDMGETDADMDTETDDQETQQ